MAGAPDTTQPETERELLADVFEALGVALWLTLHSQSESINTRAFAWRKLADRVYDFAEATE